MNKAWVVTAAVLAFAGGGLASPGAASAATLTPLVVGFTGDTSGARPNGFSSVGVPQIAFSRHGRVGLSVSDFGAGSHGNALAVSGAASALEIRLAAPTNALSLAFGNDDPAVSDTSDVAVLTLFNGLTRVGENRVNLNAHGTMDETINATGEALFDRATFQYVDAMGLPKNLAEVVDDVTIDALCTISGTTGDDTLVGTSANDGSAGTPVTTRCAPAPVTTSSTAVPERTGSAEEQVRTWSPAERAPTGCGPATATTRSWARPATTRSPPALEPTRSTVEPATTSCPATRAGTSSPTRGKPTSCSAGRAGTRSTALVGRTGRTAGPGGTASPAGLSNDQVFGGSGRDRLAGGTGRDRCDGGTGRDVGHSCEVRTRIP